MASVTRHKYKILLAFNLLAGLIFLSLFLWIAVVEPLKVENYYLPPENTLAYGMLLLAGFLNLSIAHKLLTSEERGQRLISLGLIGAHLLFWLFIFFSVS